MTLTQRFVNVLFVILACVVGCGLWVLGTQKAPALTFGVPQPQLSYNIPVNPSISDKTSYNPETAFGAFAWKAFVALNWPADADGSPLTDQTIGEAPDAPRVWEFYQAPEEVFNPKSKQSTGPKVQNLRLTEINANETLAQLRERALSEYRRGNPSQELLGIFPDLESAEILVEGSKPLVDRAGNYIINEIRMNPIEANQIVSNKWYAANSLQKFNNTDNKFALVCSQMDPDGIHNGEFPCTENDTVGAIEIKAAWKVLPEPIPQEVQSEYYTTSRTFAIQDVSEQEREMTVPVGLVGFHIMQKTSQQGWVVATFEHLNNAPDASDSPPTGSYILYDPDCTGNYCEANTPFVKEPYLWRDEFPHAATKTEGQIEPQIPSQITRLIPITQVAGALNAEWQEALEEVSASSVWKNYQLIGTQWLSSPAVPYNLQIRDIQPRQGNQASKLANVTLEPYVQKSTFGSSCITCHTTAKLPSRKEPPTVFSDFSFLIKNAR